MPEHTLEYFGKAMSPVTVDGRTPEGVAEVLTRVRGYARVVLEPGDGTRYELHVIYRPHDPDCLLVVRDGGGRPAAAFVPAWMSDFDLEPLLIIKNDWTREVLRWWLGLLFEALGRSMEPGKVRITEGIPQV